jgi:hypothetical protein
MKKYKISKHNLKEFFGFIGKKKTPAEIQKVIDNDPVLQKLQKDYIALNTKSKDYAEKIKKRSPEIYKWVKDNLTVKD